MLHITVKNIHGWKECCC